MCYPRSSKRLLELTRGEIKHIAFILYWNCMQQLRTRLSHFYCKHDIKWMSFGAIINFVPQMEDSPVISPLRRYLNMEIGGEPLLWIIGAMNWNVHPETLGGQPPVMKGPLGRESPAVTPRGKDASLRKTDMRRYRLYSTSAFSLTIETRANWFELS